MTKAPMSWKVAALLGALPLLGFWLTGLFDLDEGFYGAVAAEMNRRHEWITPCYNGHPFFEKPILIYWLTKPMLALFGPNVGPRLPSVVCAILVLFLVGWFAHRRLSPLAGSLAPLILGSSLLFSAVGRMLMTDMPLLLFLILALVAFWESLQERAAVWRGLAGAAVGFTLLAKGPVGLALFVGALAVTYFREPTLRAKMGGAWGLFVLALVLVSASWYVPAWLANGHVFVQKFLIEQNLNRFEGGDQAHSLGAAGYLLYPLVIGLGMAPWSFFLVRAWPKRSESGGECRRFLGTAALVTFAFFMASGAKLPHYVLPCAPPLALLVAHDLGARTRSPRFVVGWATAMTLATFTIVNFGFSYWYRASGNQELHALARGIAQDGAQVAAYQLPRRTADLGTGKLQSMETSHPSLGLYLNSDFAEPNDMPSLLAIPGEVDVITRPDRISAADVETAAAASRTLKLVDGHGRHYLLWRLSPRN